MARAFKKSVKLRPLQRGDLVLRVLRGLVTDPRGKFRPNWSGPYIIRELTPEGAAWLMDLDGNQFSELTCHAPRHETLDWDSLPALSDVNVSKSYNISYTKIQHKLTTVVVFTVSHTFGSESHLHIQKLYIYIYRSERKTYSDEPLLKCWPSRMRKITVSFFCTYTD